MLFSKINWTFTLILITDSFSLIINSCLPSNPEKNKEVVTTFFQQVFGDKDLTNLTNFLSPTYIQHNPNVKDGPEGLREFLESDPMKQREKRKMDIRHVIAEGDYVWVHMKSPLLNMTFAIIDIFRMECGKMAEHWDVIQEMSEDILKSSKNTHPFF